MTLVLLTLLAIIILYFVVALSPIKLCAICTAVSLSWVGLLIAYFLGWHDNLLWLGILMGGSLVGLMYKMEQYFKKKKLTNYWLIRIAIIAFGFLSVYLFLSAEWDKLILVIVAIILFSFFSLFFIKTEKDASKRRPLKDRLDHCCD